MSGTIMTILSSMHLSVSGIPCVITSTTDIIMRYTIDTGINNSEYITIKTTSTRSFYHFTSIFINLYMFSQFQTSFIGPPYSSLSALDSASWHPCTSEKLFQQQLSWFVRDFHRIAQIPHVVFCRDISSNNVHLSLV